MLNTKAAAVTLLLIVAVEAKVSDRYGLRDCRHWYAVPAADFVAIISVKSLWRWRKWNRCRRRDPAVRGNRERDGLFW